jgi:hypothetical protein
MVKEHEKCSSHPFGVEIVLIVCLLNTHAATLHDDQEDVCGDAFGSTAC